MAPHLRPLAPLAVCALALGACGQSADEDSAGDFSGQQRAVAQTVENLQKQAKKRTSAAATTICEDLLSPALIARIRQASAQTCPDALHDRLVDVDAFELQVTKVTIAGASATALVTAKADGQDDRSETLTLTRQGTSWRIATLGAVAG